MNNQRSIAIIPVRSLTTGKTRLATAVDPETRSELTRRMLAVAIKACRASEMLDRIVVISPDPNALAFARTVDPGIKVARQPDRTPGLIPALEQARFGATERGFSSIAVLFADLPLLTSADVAELLTAPGQIIVVPDQIGTGTNALILREGPVDLSSFQYRFGVSSFQKHVDEARRLGVVPAIVKSAGLAFDLDTPNDLGELIAFDPAGVSKT